MARLRGLELSCRIDELPIRAAVINVALIDVLDM